jgi:uncharacterized membrane protein
MSLLILGLAIWVFAHVFKRLLPGPRAALGDKGKGLIAFLLLGAIVLMVIGYRGAAINPVYTPFPGIGHLNNLLMFIALYLFGVSGSRGLLYGKIRHPMLWGTTLWAVAHLLVNGDQASLILFGGIGLWALMQMVLINRSTAWVPAKAGRGISGDTRNTIGTVLIFGVITGIHSWLGYNPFLGTYG